MGADAADRQEKSQRIDAEREFKRARIAQAARTVLTREGYDGLNMRAIAAEAGYAVGAVYAYFDGREQIALELAIEDLSALARRMRGAGGAEDPRGRLLARATAALDALGQGGLRELVTEALGETAHGEDPDAAGPRALNGRLIAALTALTQPIVETRGPAAAPDAALFAASVIGLATLDAWGRLDALGLNREALVARAADRALTP